LDVADDPSGLCFSAAGILPIGISDLALCLLCCQVKSETEAPKRHQQQLYLHSDTGTAAGTTTTNNNTNSSSSSNGSSSRENSSSGSNGIDSSEVCGSSSSRHDGSEAAPVPAGTRNAGAADSVEKLERVMSLCDECDIIRQPTLLGALLLVPLLSWHHKVCWECNFCCIGPHRHATHKATIAENAGITRGVERGLWAPCVCWCGCEGGKGPLETHSMDVLQCDFASEGHPLVPIHLVLTLLLLELLLLLLQLLLLLLLLQLLLLLLQLLLLLCPEF
jgi:hypothetical protein